VIHYFGPSPWGITALSKQAFTNSSEAEKPSVTLPGTVEKIIPPMHPGQPEKAQIGIEGADDLYREVRVENTLEDGDGRQVALKPGAQVNVTIAADVESTIVKQPSKSI
jgi:hypothetical protein